MAWKFLNIAKANAEIDRLNTENEKLTRERDDARAALEANNSDTVKEAEKLQGQVAEAGKTIQARDAEVTRLNGLVASKDTELATARAELSKANEKFANPSAQIQQAASVKAAEITSAQGQPPVKASPVENPSKQEGKTELKGFAKARAAFKAELNK